MTLLEECRDAVKILVRLGYDKYDRLLERIEWSIEEEKFERMEINKHFEDERVEQMEINKHFEDERVEQMEINKLFEDEDQLL